MFDYFRRGPSKESLREMLAQALRNTEAKKATVAPVVPLLALPAPRERVARLGLVTPPVIYLSGPVAPRERDWLYVKPVPPVRLPVRRPRQPYDFEHGSPEQMALLESVRQIQEKAWYERGYSREQIVEWFADWPVMHGYPPYQWTVGPPP